MRESFTPRLGTCRRRSSPRLPALFVGPAASIPARPRGGPDSSTPKGRPGDPSHFAFASETAVSPRDSVPSTFPCPAPLAEQPLPLVWCLLCPR